MSLSQLARKTGIPKSTAHCLLITLNRLGYLEHDEESGRYFLGDRFLELSMKVISGIPLRLQAMPYLRDLMNSTELTVHMAVLTHGEVVLVEKLAPAGIRRIPTWVGKRMAAHCTALGKALIAYLPEDELDHLIADRGLLRYNNTTISSVQKLKRELEHVRSVGYALDNEEEEIGTECIGAPVLGLDAREIASISIAGTPGEINSATMVKAGQYSEADRYRFILSHRPEQEVMGPARARRADSQRGIWRVMNCPAHSNRRSHVGREYNRRLRRSLWRRSDVGSGHPTSVLDR
jgi:DNA-binding IclR family transcriptional regulator